jgi:hypothetical protein
MFAIKDIGIKGESINPFDTTKIDSIVAWFSRSFVKSIYSTLLTKIVSLITGALQGQPFQGDYSRGFFPLRSFAVET